MFFVAPQPEISPIGDNEELNAWADSQNADLEKFQERYAAAMRLRGVTVTFNRQGEYSGPFTLIDPGNATLSRDGVTRDILLSRGRIQLVGMSPEQLAAYDFGEYMPTANNPNLANTGNFAPTTTTPSLTPTNPPPLGPTTPPAAPTNPNPSTVPTTPPVTPTQPPTATPRTETQPTQRPPNPPSGTVISPDMEGPFTFEQWNYLVKEKTGKVGPDPRQFGINTSRLLTFEEYQKILREIEGAGNPETPETTQPPKPSTPKKDDNTLFVVVAAVVLLLIINR
jgi:hypothetical protein